MATSGNDRGRDERVRYWRELAEYDLDTAEAMLKADRLLYVGFMCQQTIEKSLKALYARNVKKVPPYSHNLRYLASEAAVYPLLSESHRSLLEKLEPLNVESRYPDHKRRVMESLTFDRCRTLIDETREFHTWLRSL